VPAPEVLPLDTLQPTFAALIARPSVRRRLLDHGIGAVLALGYWGVVDAMVVVGAVFVVLLAAAIKVALLLTE
jgi:ABC-type proline/glycine betaine transport system permease subunit